IVERAGEPAIVTTISPLLPQYFIIAAQRLLLLTLALSLELRRVFCCINFCHGVTMPGDQCHEFSLHLCLLREHRFGTHLWMLTQPSTQPFLLHESRKAFVEGCVSRQINQTMTQLVEQQRH